MTTDIEDVPSAVEEAPIAAEVETTEKESKKKSGRIMGGGGRNKTLADTSGQDGIADRPPEVRGSVALMLAVLKDALESYCTNEFSRNENNRTQARIDEAWIMSGKPEVWRLPFGDVCDALGLEAEAIRERLKKWKATVPNDLQPFEWHRALNAVTKKAEEVLEEPASDTALRTRSVVSRWVPLNWQKHREMLELRRDREARNAQVLEVAQRRGLIALSVKILMYGMRDDGIELTYDQALETLGDLEHAGQLRPATDMTGTRRLRKRPRPKEAAEDRSEPMAESA